MIQTSVRMCPEVLKEKKPRYMHLPACRPAAKEMAVPLPPRFLHYTQLVLPPARTAFSNTTAPLEGPSAAASFALLLSAERTASFHTTAVALEGAPAACCHTTDVALAGVQCALWPISCLLEAQHFLAHYCCRSRMAINSCFICPTSLCKLSSLTLSSATAADDVAATDSTCWLRPPTVLETYRTATARHWDVADARQSTCHCQHIGEVKLQECRKKILTPERSLLKQLDGRM